MSEPSERRLREVAKRHKPRGWAVVERGDPKPPGKKRTIDMRRVAGLTDFDTETIYTLPIVNRYALYVFLHECGHANLHQKDCIIGCHNPPDWQIEYEAEQYAISAMRGAGISVPRAVHAEARDYVASLLFKENCADVPDKVWRFAQMSGVDKSRKRR